MTTQLYMAVAAVLGIAGLLAFPGAMGYNPRTVRLKFAELVLFLAMAAIGIIGYGDKFSPTNNPPNGLNRPMMMMFNPQPAGPTVTETDVARGFSVVSVGTNEVFDFARPTCGVRVAKWWLRGGSNDKAFVPGGIAMIGGEILDKLPHPTARYCPLKATSLLVAGESEFWYQQTASNSTVYTWKDAYLLRNLSLPFSMQAEIFGNGDFEYRYDLSRISDIDALTNVVIGAKLVTNELDDVSALLDGTNVLSSIRFRRLSEFDWDGDGLANEIDTEPYASNGDCFGTGEGWLAANFAVCLATNANPGAYYELEFTATRDVTLVHVACDGPSDLGDMVVIANSNQTCRIPLLMGAGYEIAATHPLSEVQASDANAEVVAGNGSTVGNPGEGEGVHLTISYPLAFSVFDSGNGGAEVSVSPLIPGLELAAVYGGCCSNPVCGLSFTWGCSGACGCGNGLHEMTAAATWSGYSRQFGWSCWCPCVHSGEAEGQEPRLVLDAPRTLYTNGNGGAEISDIMPVTAGLVFQGATNGTLTLSLTGGDTGLNVWETSNRTSRVNMPVDWDVSQCPGKTFYVEGTFPIHRGANGFCLEWSGSDSGETLSTNSELAVYCPVVNVVNKSIYDNGDLCNPSGIVVGTNACFAVGFSMVQPPASEIEWSVVEGNASFVGPHFGDRVRVASDVPNQKVTLRAQVADCRSRPIEISAHVVTQQVVKLTVWIVGDDNGTYYASDANAVSNLMAGVNKIYEQIGVSFYIDTINYTNNTKWLDLSRSNNSLDRVRRRELVDCSSGSGGLELYFVNRIARGVNADYDKYGIVVSTNALVKTVAHEIGHGFGCYDVFDVKKDNRSVHLQDSSVCCQHAPKDSSNGSGCRYYLPGIAQDAIIQRVLMYGFGAPDARDIPSGFIHGFASDGGEGLVDVGFFRDGTRRVLRLHQ